MRFSGSIRIRLDFRVRAVEHRHRPAPVLLDAVDVELDGYRIGIASVASTRGDHGLDPVAEGQRAAVVLWTDDTVAAYEAVTKGGAPALAAPHEWLGRLLIAWTADPDGNPIQIVQPLRKAPTGD